MEALKFGNGVWATKTGSSLAYNDQSGNYKPLPFNVVRNSTATRVNKKGLIEVVGHDKLRIDYTDTDKGVALLEPSRTNLEDKSNEFITWSSNSNITRTADYITSPDGTQNATRLQFTANGFCSNKTQSLATYTMSCYAKRNDSGTQNVGFFTNGSGVVNSAWAVTSDWKRFSYTFPALNGSAMGIAGVSGADISVYGFQLEGLASYPTSYIPTSGSAVTRASDLASGSGNSEVFNDSEGVLFANIAALANDGTNRQSCINDNSTSDRVMINLHATSNQIQGYITNGSGEQADMRFVVADTTLLNKVAVKYKLNDCALWVNGFEVATDNSATMPIGLKQYNFDNSTGSLPFYGKTKEIGYYDAILTDSELEKLTSYRSLSELVTELNLNTL